MSNYDDTVAGLQESRRAYLDSHRENSARRAKCSLTWTTVGIGEVRQSTYMPFKLRFSEEPSFTSGMVLDDADELVSGHFPRVGAGVYEWKRDAQGFYTGCWCFFTVDTIGPGEVPGQEPNYTIHHHLVFEGMAIKDIPAELLDF